MVWNCSIVDGHFRVSLHDKKPDLEQLPMPASELPAKMHDLGVCNSLLPQELLSEDWIVTEIDGQKNSYKELIAVALANQKTDQSVRFDIRSYVSTRPSSEPQFDLKKSYTYVEEIDTEIEFTVNQIGDMYRFKISSKKFAKGVYLDFDDMDCIFSDNWFDLHGQDTYVIVNRMSLPLSDIEEKLKIKTYFDLSSPENYR